MPPIVLVGHRHSCPLHGEGTVQTGADGLRNADGRAVACVGDTISCGAVIVSGSSLCAWEGQPVARQGDTTDHGGTLVEGEPDWLVD